MSGLAVRCVAFASNSDRGVVEGCVGVSDCGSLVITVGGEPLVLEDAGDILPSSSEGAALELRPLPAATLRTTLGPMTRGLRISVEDASPLE